MSRDITLLHISRPKGSADGIGESKHDGRQWYELKKDSGDTEAGSGMERLAPVFT